MNYELLKVFNANTLPDYLYEYISDYLEVSNNSYKHWFIEPCSKVPIKEHKSINIWLMERGASTNEKVLFKFSW